MPDQNIVTVPEGESVERRAEIRRARAERRRMLAARNAEVPQPVEEDEPEVQITPKPARETRPTTRRSGEPVTVTAETFALPPRAQLDKGASTFGRFVRMSFLAGVVAPTIIAALFYMFVASDQYGTQSSFAVRGASTASAGAMSLGAMMGGAGMGGGAGAVPMGEIADSHILQAYIQSREMVEALIKEANFLEIYSRQSADQYYRLDPTLPIESLVSYWEMMSHVTYHIDTGIIDLTVRAFRPSDAETITSAVIRKAEELVNELSRRSREDSMRMAENEVRLAEQRFKDARTAVASYRTDELEIDPTATASARQEVIAGLQGDLATLQSQLIALRKTMSENSPRVVYVRTQIEALERQVEAERTSVAVPAADATQPVLTDRLSRYEELLAEREFAEKAYLSALSTLESARVEALKQQRYLAVFVRGTAPEDSRYPQSLRWTLILFGTLLAIWGLMTIVGAAIRDRMA